MQKLTSQVRCMPTILEIKSSQVIYKDIIEVTMGAYDEVIF